MVKIVRGALFLLFWASTVFSQVAEVKEETHRYLGGDIYFSQSVGAGAFSRKLDPDPSVSSWLSLYPSYTSKQFWGNRKIKGHLEFGVDYEWMAPEGKNKASFADVKFRLKLLNAYKSDLLGFTFTPGLKIEIPTTSSSSIANKVLGIGTNLKFAWKKWGVFLNYKPTVISYLYSVPYKSTSCSSDSSEADVLANGQCSKEGQQTLLMVKNGVYLGYTLNAHTIMVAFKSYHGLLRAPSPESGGVLTNQRFTEATRGFVEYTYEMPTDVPVYLSLGVSSYNAAYDPRDGFRMPFFSQKSAAQNFSTVYFSTYIVL